LRHPVYIYMYVG